MFLQIERKFETKDKHSSHDSSSEHERSGAEQGIPEEELKQKEKKD